MLDLSGKKICLVGFGREGKSTLKIFRDLDPKKKIAILDAKSGAGYLKPLKDYDFIVRSPGVPYKLVKKHAGAKAIITSQTKLFFDLCPAKIIGVTGTKGKSTTASVIAAVLRQKFTAHLLGNIGRPPLDYLAKIKSEDWIVFELSSHQLSDLEKSPPVAVLLNLFPEHLDYYADFGEYALAKAQICRFQTTRDLLIYNRDDKQISKIAAQSPARKISFSSRISSGADCQVKGNYIYYQDQPIFPLDKASLSGGFNLANVMPAIILGKELGIAENLIVKAIANFQPLPHRLEMIGKVKGITFVNDSLATVPQATIQAIAAYKDTLGCLIVGGYDRGIGQTPLVQSIIKQQIPVVIVLPDTGKQIGRLIQGKTRQVFSAADMRQAVALAKEHTPKGKVCLMSPGAASFNLFKDYRDRGKQFKYWVNKL